MYIYVHHQYNSSYYYLRLNSIVVVILQLLCYTSIVVQLFTLFVLCGGPWRQQGNLAVSRGFVGWLSKGGGDLRGV